MSKTYIIFFKCLTTIIRNNGAFLKVNKQFWKLLADLRELDTEKADPADCISLAKWYKYFANLLSQNLASPYLPIHQNTTKESEGNRAARQNLDQEITLQEVTV